MPSAARKAPATAPSEATAKPAVKSTPKPPAAAKAVKPAVKAAAALVSAPAKPAAPAAKTTQAAAARSPKVDKPKKPKLVRDSFTIPKAEYAVLEELKQRAAKGGGAAKKSELLRAGIKALAGMTDAAFQAAMKAVPAIKTGRPAKD